MKGFIKIYASISMKYEIMLHGFCLFLTYLCTVNQNERAMILADVK